MPVDHASQPTVVVTGALSYTGQYATRILLDRGYKVRTLTHHVDRENPFGDKLQVLPYNFDDPEKLAASLRGASALINTYWVRFPHGAVTFEKAVANTRTLFRAAKNAGVRRIVHVSIANPALDSPLGYYKGKAELEQSLKESGLSYAILRPTVIYGPEDILINNIAWFVRHLPVFGVPGNGRFSVRPIFVEDMAQLMVAAIEQQENTITDAVGPESFTFNELVKLIAKKVHRGVWLLHLPAPLAYVSTRIVGWMVGDVVLTWEEYEGLVANLLASDAPAAGNTRLSEWLAANSENIGRKYASEIARHYPA